MDGNVVVVAKRNRCLSPLAPLARFRRHAHAAERADDADGPTRRIAVSAADRGAAAVISSFPRVLDVSHNTTYSEIF